MLNGYGSINVAGSTIYGLRNFPQRASDVHGLDLKVQQAHSGSA